MINIRPFKGVCYNLDKITDLSQVVCPPYDVINKEDQDFYYKQSPYNFIRLILNKVEPQDNSIHNKYSRAAVFFNEWLKLLILKQDQEEALYFYRQDFFYEDKELSRFGFIALLELDDSGIVFPHENTHTAPKNDRLELVKNIKSNLSPIFTIFSDKSKIIDSIFTKEFSHKKPDFLLKDTAGIRNSIWRLTDKEKISKLNKAMSKKQIFIADGHHRFEVALMYLKLIQKNDKDYSPAKGYNYVMTYFTPFESEGLCIMPVHRIVNLVKGIDLLKNTFKITKLNSIEDMQDKLNSYSRKKHVFGLYYKGQSLLLELKNNTSYCGELKEKKCFKDLDVAILDFYILNELLKIKKDAIIYTKDIIEAKECVDKNDSFAAFILRQTTIEQIKDVALCGEKMPPKSTYFYPKLLSGLVVHRFDQGL